MGFSLFKKKNKDKTPKTLPNTSAATTQRSMTSSPTKGPNTPSTASSPRILGTPIAMSSPALSVNEWGQVPSLSNTRRIKLRCVLDPLPSVAGDDQEYVNEKGELLKELFYMTADLDASIEDLRLKIVNELAIQGKYNVGIYKVAIPWAAHYQAKTYSHRYALPTHLISHFPSFNLDDPSQLNASYSLQPLTQHLVTPADAEKNRLLETTVEDWWPEGVDNKDGAISVLIRLGEPEPTGLPPFTLLVHFANQQTKSLLSLPQLSPSSMDLAGLSGEKEAPNPPLAIEVSRNATISQLKEAVMKADGRPVGLLEKVKLWKVDLSWKQILDCESMADGKEDNMPWPYSPDAPETTPLQDTTVPIDCIFPDHRPNTNLISIFVWIHPSALGILTRSRDLTLPILGEAIPNFQYPMKIRRHASKIERQAMLEKNKVRTITVVQTEGGGANYSRRPSLARVGRNATAPSSAASSPGTSPVLAPLPFGKRGILKRSSSGLSHGHMSPTSPGVGFGNLSLATLYRSPNGSVSSSNVTSPFSSDSEDSGPSSVPHTPIATTFDMRGDFIMSPLPGPAKTVRWSQDMDIVRKKVSMAQTVTIIESDEIESGGAARHAS